MHLDAAAAGDLHFDILTGAGKALLADVVVSQQAQIAGLEQLAEGNALQAERLAGEGVDVAQSDAMEIRRVIDADEGRQNAVQLRGKVLPLRIDRPSALRNWKLTTSCAG